jgi:hypothetical protein
LLFAVLYGASIAIPAENSTIKMLYNTGLLAIFLLFTLKTVKKEIGQSRTKHAG